MTEWTRTTDWPKGLFRRQNGTFYLRRQHTGVRLTRSLQTENLARAMELVTKLNAKVDEKGVTLTRAVGQHDVTLRDAAHSYITRPNNPLRPNSIKEYRRALDNLVRVFREILGVMDPPLRAVNNALVKRFVDFRLAEPAKVEVHPNTPTVRRGAASAKTIQSEVDLLKAVLRYAAQRGVLEHEPVIDARVADANTRQSSGLSARACPIHNPADVARLLVAARSYDDEHAGEWPWSSYFADIVAGYLYLGLRDQELVHLEWADVDLDLRTVRIRRKQVVCTRRIQLGPAAKDLATSLVAGRSSTAKFIRQHDDVAIIGRVLHLQNEAMLREVRVSDIDLDKAILSTREAYAWQPKGLEGKPIPVNPPLHAILSRLHSGRASNYVFPDRDGGYRRFHLDRHLKQIVTRAGLPASFRTHDLRHTFGTQLRRAGARLETIKELMRHASIEDTLRYAVYADGEGKAAVESLQF